jgi:predicted metalloprotease with PDZ domain
MTTGVRHPAHAVGALALLCCLAAPAGAAAQNPIEYVVTFPEPEHHWVQVEMTVRELGAEPLRARMSRSSPGRYAVHEFAKNVFHLEAWSGSGARLAPLRPEADEWRVAGHDGTVRLVYRIFGDTPDGTYMGVDATHARLNMPATFMWAMGHDARPIRIRFVPPDGSGWRAGTQLVPTSDPFTFTAPNLQYFMDSPTELAPFIVSTFTVPDRDGDAAAFRVFAHAGATQADVDALARLIEPLAREQMAVFGEWPDFEPGYYTFILDYLPWADGDGMEHRNSTFISSAGVSLGTAAGRRQALGAISHELFHVWNVERIRPAGLEPFDFTRQNITCCLWLAEGFTEYYGTLTLRRAGLADDLPLASVPYILAGSGRHVRSAVEMSEHAPFEDAAVSVDAHDRARTFLSYYAFGEALALALDLSLRERSDGRVTLDDYMRRLWERYGRPGGRAPGLVDRPYALADLRATLAEVAGSDAFAADFFGRHVEGREPPDYGRLLGLTGFSLATRRPGAAWAGDVPFEDRGGELLVAGVVPFETPAYRAGLDRGDVVVSIAGQRATHAAWTALARLAPGTRVDLRIRRRDGRAVGAVLVLDADPTMTVVSIEQSGGGLTAAQRRFREAWLASNAMATAGR